ncbi:MAG TPA: hypothetical protein VKZ44_03385 [Taishania sp.]|nr:hypothetical protein [Taishania sp.]
MKKVFSTCTKLTLALGLVALTSCKKDKTPDEELPASAYRPYHIVMGQGSTGESLTFSQGITVEQMRDESYTVSFNNYGFEIPSVRTARMYTSSDGKTLYNLNYGGGEVAKFRYDGGQKYTQLLTTSVQAAIGTANPRWTKISDEYAVLHHVVLNHSYTPDSVYQSTTSTIKLAIVNLASMSLGTVRSFTLPMDADGGFVFRIDAPVLQNGKLIYGCGKQKMNTTTNTAASHIGNDVMSLVVDFPSLENEQYIRTTIAKGNTNGYRTPVAHKIENGDVYQVSTSKGLNILKLVNDQYDESYNFKLDDILGYACQTNGWFYVGNGIGYIPVLNVDAGAASSANWDIVRVDIFNQTAVKMNLGQSFWLQQYQWASVIEGKLYMAITPLGGQGRIYIFDPQDATPNGFTKGAKLQTGTDAFYLGIF